MDDTTPALPSAPDAEPDLVAATPEPQSPDPVTAAPQPKALIPIEHQDPEPGEDGPGLPGAKPKFLVIGDKLYCQTEDGELVLPLRFRTKLLREVNSMSELDETEQLFWLLTAIGDTDTTKRMDELDVFETLAIVGAYFQEFEARSQAAMGESRGSLNS